MPGKPRGAEDRKPRLSHAINFAHRVGYPAIVKPNLLTRGILVTKVYTDEELVQAAEKVFEKDQTALVQRFYGLRDFRLVVLDDHVVHGYERIPLTVTGDGKRTLGDLVRARQEEIVEGTNDIDLEVDDFRIRANCAREGLSLGSVLPPGRSVRLLDNANLSNGGRGIDVTGSVAPEYQKIAVEVTRSMNLRLCGVDIMAEDIAAHSEKHIVLEVNGAPGYANVGEVRGEILEQLYYEVLQTLENSGKRDRDEAVDRPAARF